MVIIMTATAQYALQLYNKDKTQELFQLIQSYNKGGIVDDRCSVIEE